MPIVASAQHAATLHYCCNDRAFAWGPVNAERGDLVTQGHGHDHNGAANGHEEEHTLAPQVLLIDAGCEWRNYASDSELSRHLFRTKLIYIRVLVTRTTPVKLHS